MVWLVVGLGNPGPEYAATRHNIGQMVVEILATQNKARWTTHKSRTDVAAFKIGVGSDAASVILAKSKSYMNESGGPIKALATFYKVDPSHPGGRPGARRAGPARGPRGRARRRR